MKKKKLRPTQIIWRLRHENRVLRAKKNALNVLFTEVSQKLDALSDRIENRECETALKTCRADRRLLLRAHFNNQVAVKCQLSTENRRLTEQVQAYKDQETDRTWRKIHREEWIERCAAHDEAQEATGR